MPRHRWFGDNGYGLPCVPPVPVGVEVPPGTVGWAPAPEPSCPPVPFVPEPVPVVLVVSLAVPWVFSPEFISSVSPAEVPPVVLPWVDSDSVVVPSVPELPLQAVVIATAANSNDAKSAAFKLRFFMIYSFSFRISPKFSDYYKLNFTSYAKFLTSLFYR